jgi:hypothetical protein
MTTTNVLIWFIALFIAVVVVTHARIATSFFNPNLCLESTRLSPREHLVVTPRRTRVRRATRTAQLDNRFADSLSTSACSLGPFVSFVKTLARSTGGLNIIADAKHDNSRGAAWIEEASFSARHGRKG